MKVLNFSDFINESQNQMNLGDVSSYLGDGLRFRCYPNSQQPECCKIILDDENLHSNSFFYNDLSGKEVDKIWIPKDVTEMEQDGETFVITIHPEKKWFCVGENRKKIEDFLVGFIEFESENSLSENSILEEIEDDLTLVFDILDLDFEIESIHNLGKNNFEIICKGGKQISLKKNGKFNLYSDLDFYNSDQETNPSLKIQNFGDSHSFSVDIPQIGTKNFSCDINDVSGNPFYNILLKKSLKCEKYTDIENFTNHFQKIYPETYKNSHQDPKKEQERKQFLRDLKTVLGDYMSEEKIRTLTSL